MKKLFSFKNGVQDGLPICFAYFAVSFAFGILVTSNGLSILLATVISGTNLTSAGQFEGVMLIFASSSVVVLFFTVLLINSRYLLMSLTLSQYFSENLSTGKRLIMSFFITDEIFAVANSRKNGLCFKYFMGLSITPYFGWTIGTLLGGLCGNVLPETVQTAMNIALYCMFIAIIIPPAKKSLPITITILISLFLSCCFYYIPYIKALHEGLKFMIVAIVASAVCSLLFPLKEDEIKEGESV
ncbi:MAG: AzlC family ABC transporter permease [Clostridia bacterium]|nr:AzlC family ABC transporter permease [Clostridia bacterium]